MFTGEYAPLGQDIFVAEEMANHLSPPVLSDLLDTLWRGDCQTCGSSLVSGPVAVHAEVIPTLAHVSLHHPACKQPAWQDEGPIITSPASQGAHVTYLHAGFILDQMPVVVINPRLEMATLQTVKSDEWTLADISLFREYHHMFPGGPIPMPPSMPAVGIDVDVEDDCLLIRAPEAWNVTPGFEVLAKIVQSQGLLLAITNLYHSQPMNVEVAKRILNHPTRTTIGWLSLHPQAARGVPAAEYVLFSNQKFAAVGIVIGRNKNQRMPLAEARAWGKRQARQAGEGASAQFIDEERSEQSATTARFFNSLSAESYMILSSADGWRLIRTYSFHGGRIDDDELIDWANRVVRRKSPHRVAQQWAPGPKVRSGLMLISHAPPTEQ